MPANYEPIAREALNIAEVCAAAGIGRTKVYEAISEGRLKARKCGKRTLVLTADLRDFLAALPSAT
jgi:excisionase family DNA binding protein